MARWKGIDLNQVKFGNDKISFEKFREVLKKNVGDRDIILPHTVKIVW
jgi:hypothetical protein